MKRNLKKIEKFLIFISTLSIIIGIGIIMLYAHKNEDGIIKFGDIYLIKVTDNNMTPNINDGDLIIIEQKNPKEYHINNIVAYYLVDGDGNISTKVSRIVDGYSNDSATSYIFMLKSDMEEEKTTISGGDVIGEWNGKSIKSGAKYISFLVSRIGFLTCTIIPLILLFIVEFILFIIAYLDKNKYSYNNL